MPVGRPLVRRWLGLCLLFGIILATLRLRYGSWRRKKYTPWNLKAHMSPPEKAVVIPKMRKDDISWALALAPQWETYAYSTALPPEPDYLAFPTPNRGRETLTYLTFIVDNYDSLPTYTAFVHGAKGQWHNDLLGANTADLLQNLRLDNVKEQGFMNLRCSQTPGCPISVNPLAPTEIDMKDNGTRANFKSIYQDLFNVTGDKVPEHLGNVCCAQFVVSRERIRARPKEDYERMRRWVLETKVTDDFGIGWVFEQVWHVVFGMEPVNCPRFEQCRCDLIGWCDKPIPQDLKPLVLGAHPWLGSRLGRIFGNDNAAGDWMNLRP